MMLVAYKKNHDCFHVTMPVFTHKRCHDTDGMNVNTAMQKSVQELNDSTLNFLRLKAHVGKFKKQHKDICC